MQFNISQLSDGVYRHRVEEKLFKYSDDDSVKNLDVHLKIDKAFDSLHFQLNAAFDKKVQCDRCLEDNEKHFQHTYEFVYSRSASLTDLSDPDSDVRFLQHDQNIIDITEDVIQTVLLAIPMKNVCKDDCKGLCSTCGINKNKEKCSCSDQKIDLRLESLLKFKV